jgi:hypothetical protein
MVKPPAPAGSTAYPQNRGSMSYFGYTRICSYNDGETFDKHIVCSDAAAESARHGFTAVDRPEGYLGLSSGLSRGRDH